MRVLKQNTAVNIMVFMTDSADHVTGKTGLALTITASKDGDAFASITPVVTERGNGWYNIALTPSDVDTLGDLAVHITSTGADDTDLIASVVVDEAEVIRKLTGNKVTKSGDLITIYEDNGSTPWIQYDLADGGRVEII